MNKKDMLNSLDLSHIKLDKFLDFDPMTYLTRCGNMTPDTNYL